MQVDTRPIVTLGELIKREYLLLAAVDLNEFNLTDWYRRYRRLIADPSIRFDKPLSSECVGYTEQSVTIPCSLRVRTSGFILDFRAIHACPMPPAFLAVISEHVHE